MEPRQRRSLRSPGTNTPGRTAANRRSSRLDSKAETILKVAVAILGPLFAHVEKSQGLALHATYSEKESDRFSGHRSSCDWTSSSNRPQSSRSRSCEWLTVIPPAKAYFDTAMGSRSYRLADRSQHPDDDAARTISKMSKRLEVMLKSQMFYGANLITILSFLTAFQMACAT